MNSNHCLARIASLSDCISFKILTRLTVCAATILGLALVGCISVRAQSLYATGTNNVVKFNSSGGGTQFNVNSIIDHAGGLAIDGAGNLYVSNFNSNFVDNATILKFDSNGVGTLFASGGLLSYPASLAFDNAGNLYVGNIANNTIDVFSSSGQGTVFAIGAPLNGPDGLAFGPTNQTSVTPEPGSIGLLVGAGLTGLNLLARRRRK